jgi:peptidoglycan hydrolase-like protein with peptidoglycan-binding domain
MSELTLDKNYKKGHRGKEVKKIQAWLSLNGLGLKIDGDFGPATDYAVREFQKREGLTVDGIVGNVTFTKLITPMKNALKEIPRGNKSLGEMVVAYAKQHLKQHPREIGGQHLNAKEEGQVLNRGFCEKVECLHSMWLSLFLYAKGYMLKIKINITSNAKIMI